jgi:hypothetical protein
MVAWCMTYQTIWRTHSWGTSRHSVAGMSSLRWRATNTSAGSRMPSVAPHVSVALNARRSSWSRDSGDRVAGLAAVIAIALAVELTRLGINYCQNRSHLAILCANTYWFYLFIWTWPECELSILSMRVIFATLFVNSEQMILRWYLFSSVVITLKGAFLTSYVLCVNALCVFYIYLVMKPCVCFYLSGFRRRF